MKYFPLIWAGLWRKPLRTTLTMLALVAAFTLFGLMQGINAGLLILRDIGHKETIVVYPRFGAPLPMAYKDQIAEIPGVKKVVATMPFGGTINGDPKRQAFVIAVEDGYFDIADQFDITPAQIAELRAKRNAFVATPLAAERWGLKVGDRIILNSQPKKDGTRDWEFDLIAIVDLRDLPNIQMAAYGNFEYVNEERLAGKDMGVQIALTLDDADKAVAVSKAVEDRFLNSAAPVRTQNEGMTFEQQYEDNNLPEMMQGIIISTLFSLLLLTFNTIMQSFRERIAELGTLKAIGFSDRQMLGLVIAEAMVQCIGGAVIGLAIAPAIMPYAKPYLTNQGAQFMTFSWEVAAWGLFAAAVVAILSAAVPAVRTARMQIVTALAAR